MSPSAAEPRPHELRCPSCVQRLSASEPAAWTCTNGHRYPITAGILDCRPVLQGFDVQGDAVLAEELAAMKGASFEDLLRRYWSHQPEVTTELAERFITGDLIGARRAAAVADQIEALLGGPLLATSVALEVGSGTAALGAELARRCASVIITDVSLAWLVLAARRLDEAGLRNTTLVAATGDALPVGRRSLDLVVAADVVEHVPSAADLIQACYSALKAGGALWLSTPNRLSLTPEPHVRLWGVGLLPRAVGRAYVRRLRGVPYDDIETLSLFQLRRLLARTDGVSQVVAPEITAPVRATYGPVPRRLIDGYHLGRRIPGLRALVLVATPLFHALLRRPPDA